MISLRMFCISFIAVMLLIPSGINAQSFTWVAPDTALSGPLGTEFVFDTDIANTSSSPLTLALVRVENNLPADWSSSMCLDVCFPPFVDSIATTSAFGSSPLNPGDTREFSLHIYAQNTPGTGTVRVLCMNVSDRNDSREFLFRATSDPSAVGSEDPSPADFSLQQNYPNPFNPTTRIAYSVAQSGPVDLSVYDLLGRKVQDLLHGPASPGSYEVVFDASGLPSGVYIYRFHSGQYTTSRKMILTK